MRRFTRSFRTRSNVGNSSALQDQFIRQLTEEAQAVLTQLSQQFTQDLQNQASQTLQSTVASSLPGAGGSLDVSDASGEVNAISSFSQLLSTGARYLISRPRTSTSEKETSRSQNADANFKLSRAQQLVEAGITLDKGEKNR